MKIQVSKGSPTEIYAGSARSCYSKTLVKPEKVKNWDKKNALLKDLLSSGHHTTMQHVLFSFEIEGISRFLIWKLFHSHAHYNSDQASQRYAIVSPNINNYFIPKNINKNKATELFSKIYDNYIKLTNMLEEIYKKDENPVVRKLANKKAMEMARYILPQSTKTHLYHSINLITALRYIAGINLLEECDEEAELFKSKLKEKLLEIDEDFAILIEEAENFKGEYVEPDFSYFPEIKKDKNINVFDLNSKYGLPTNKNYAQSININSLFYPTESMNSFLVRARLSLSADAQNQRHRSSIGLRKNLFSYYHENKKNIYTPNIIKENKEILKLYNESISMLLNYIEENKLKNKDIGYFLPNSFLIEIIEKNDIVNFNHKAKLRTCLNAQEEIRFLTEEIIEEIKKEAPDLAYYFVPPCVSRFRQQIKPYCSEGSRFCGKKVWKYEKYRGNSK
jgi:flavin-dependent thymidylate synthase